MTRQEFIAKISELLDAYIEYGDITKGDLQLRVNPESKYVSIVGEDYLQHGIDQTDENIEVGAAAENQHAEDYALNQIDQDPDFYPVRDLVKDGKIDISVLEKIADKYF